MSGAPIEDYLDGLYRRLRGEPRRARRLLDEAADHLYATADALVAGGATRIEAEREAVRRFGSPDPLVRALRAGTVRALAAETVRTVLALAGIGLVAVGLSGGVAAVFNATLGKSFVGGAPAQQLLGLCAGGLRQQVGCSFSVLENSQDAVSLRVLAGIVGLVLLGLARLSQRVFRPADRAVLPRWMTDVLATAAFAVAAAALIAASADLAVRTGAPGVGFYLSGAIVAALGAVGFGVRSARALLDPAG